MSELFADDRVIYQAYDSLNELLLDPSLRSALLKKSLATGTDHQTPSSWLAHSVIEIFELFLDSRGIQLDTDEKKEAIAIADSPDSVANIYGSDYSELYDSIMDLIQIFKSKELES